MAFPVGVGAVRGLLKEVATSARDERPLAVGGALADVLCKELVRGGSSSAVRTTDDARGAAAFVYVLGRDVTEADEATLKRAHRARVPVVAVAASRDRIPYVLATDIVILHPGESFPVPAIAEAVARKLGKEGVALAARLPVLREPVCTQLVASAARRNAIVAAAVFVPGADLPVLTLAQLRLVLRLAAAHGQELDRDRIPELLTTLGAGLGFRAAARELLDIVPIAGWAIKGAVAYSGTRALGEAAIRFFGARSSPAMQPRGEASPAAP